MDRSSSAKPLPPDPSHAEEGVHNFPDYTLSDKARSASHVARLAPTLKEAELRVLIALDALDPGPPHHSVRISSRKLAELAAVARSNVVKALDSLNDRAIITIRQGTSTTPAGILLNYAKTVPMERGPITGPPRSQNSTTLDLFQDHPGPVPGPPGGLTAGPPPTENKGLPGSAERVDISIDSIRLIDRLLRANPKRVDPATLTHFRNWLHGYMAKFGEANPHPPDDRLVAQFLAIAPAPQLQQLLDNLMAERQTVGWSYAWFVTVGLQRIHGIKPEVLKARRAELRVVRAKPAPADQPPPAQENSECPAPNAADSTFADELVRAATAGVKSL